ncbi:hypothetical protein GVAV_003238 [Gurleya vavrai]
MFFVDLITNVHTQAIESYWSKIKNIIKSKNGLPGIKIEHYLEEWMWKSNTFKKDWNELINLIKI